MGAIELLASGNAAMASGALAGALDLADPSRPRSHPFLLAAGYPITPVNEVVDWASRHFGSLGAEFIQAESEIAAAAMAIGAAALGTPAFTATSGPGMSLMQESLSFASAMELGGLVFANVMRGGPGLGSVQGSQADLLQAIGGGHGDRPIHILAPSSVQEMFDLTRLAFRLSARHRLPALLLTDGHLALMSERFVFDGARIPERLARPEGVQTTLFVREGTMAAHGWRLRQRLEGAARDEEIRSLSVATHRVEESGAPAEILIVAHGIFARVARGVVDRARSKGLPVGLMTLRVLSPFPEAEILAAASRHRALFVLEGSQGQLHGLVRQVCGGSVPLGLGSYPGGVLPDEEQVCQALEALHARLTPEIDHARRAALESREMMVSCERDLVDPGRGAHDTLGPGENAHDIDMAGVGAVRKPPSPIMTDACPPQCPGCGQPPVLTALGRVLAEVADLRPVVYSPVGCAVFAGDLFDTSQVDAIQVPHGRGPAAAAASKRVRPTSPVVVIQGDGDALTIGGNELLHVIERGDPITLLILNNGLFGMTGGQVSATAPHGAPGREGWPLDLFALTDHPGVAYFRRLIAADAQGIAALEEALRQALAHQMTGHGLSVIEVLAACPTHQSDESARRHVHEVLAKVFPTSRRRGDDFERPMEALRGALSQSAEEGQDQTEGSEALREMLREQFAPPPAAGEFGLPSPPPSVNLFLCGRGGQGIQLLAHLLQGALIAAYPGSTLLPWYGPEVRRGVTTASLRLSAEPNLSPVIAAGEADLFLCLDGEGLAERSHLIRRPGGLMVCDTDLCPEPPQGEWRSLRVPATALSRRGFGSASHANMILLGHALRALDLFPLETLRGAVDSLCPAPEENWRALTLSDG
ncbi:2-oxoacid:acceptor oxidoreductase family protein [Candidatus Sumerlaeota bacterium]|nr:2-oxoacid:acceptor oxidoreductase family protein [Candidatus Sumerlaeota bacterium]